MPRIAPIDPGEASPEARALVEDHLRQGYRLTNEKRTLIRSAKAFEAIEVKSYELDKVLAGLVGQRAADFFEYAVSAENDCLVCSTYFVKLLRKYGVEDVASFELTNGERLLMEFGRCIGRDPKSVTDELFDRLRACFSEETIVVATAMGAMMLANNCVNDVLGVEPESVQ